MKNFIISLLAIVLVGGGVYWYMQRINNGPVAIPTQDEAVTTQPVATTAAPEKTDGGQTVVGTSVEGKSITAYHFGNGQKEVVFVGGLHGGYEWNTVLVAYNLIDYLVANPSAVPADIKVTVIPVVNPDGLSKVVGTSSRFTAADVATSQATQIAGRFNANTVDLNRNFDCDWQTTGVWQKTKVSGGKAAFSEPESIAMKSYFETNKPSAVVVWYSSAGGVFSSNCHGNVLPETNTLTTIFAKASGYPAHEVFDYYATTGDMVNWLAKIKIPAISILLTNHTDTEWSKNQAGVDAILQYLAK